MDVDGTQAKAKPALNTQTATQPQKTSTYKSGTINIQYKITLNSPLKLGQNGYKLQTMIRTLGKSMN